MKYEAKHRNQYSVFLGVEYVSSILLFFSFSIFIGVHALTRGTPYDNMLTSKNINSNNSKTNSRQTNLMSTSEETTTTRNQNATNEEFIYADYGSDEIEGSSISDHLSGESRAWYYLRSTRR